MTTAMKVESFYLLIERLGKFGEVAKESCQLALIYRLKDNCSVDVFVSNSCFQPDGTRS